MPKWRKLYTKTCDSPDVNEMPNDFTRLMWVMLPLGLDRCGRGYDNPAWVRSQIFKMRVDVTIEMIQDALDWYEAHRMIERYEKAGRKYFWIPTWHKHQGDTSREADSNLPAPSSYDDPYNDNSEDTTNSRATHEQVVTKSRSDVDTDTDTDTDTKGASPRDSLPHNLDGWLAFVREGKGSKGGMTARLGRMLVTLWPERYDGLDPPYSKLGGVARNVGGASRLAHLLWQANAHKVTGDPLEYASKMHSHSNGKDAKRTTADKWEEIDEWAES